MNKTQKELIAVAVLLIVFAFAWKMSQPASPDGTPPTPAPGPQEPAVGEGEAPRRDFPSPAIPEPELNRDPFRLPPPLEEKVIAKNQALWEERKRLEEERLRRLGSGQAASAQQPSAPDLSGYQLQGLFWGVANPQAIINRQIVSVGDEVGPAKVVAIRPDGVVLSIDGTEALIQPKSPVGQANTEGQPYSGTGTAMPRRGR